MRKSFALSLLAASLALASPVLAQGASGRGPLTFEERAQIRLQAAREARAQREAWNSARQTWRGNAAGEARASVGGREPYLLAPAFPDQRGLGGNGGGGNGGVGG
jgi:hypothetical protein